MVWREHLHPRDELGRFRESGWIEGPSGIFDRMAGQVANQHHARVIEEYEANWQRQFNYFQPLQRSGQLTPELDAEWDRDIERRNQLERQVPKAHHKGLVPYPDGTWRNPKYPDAFAYDENGLQLPPAAVRGWERVGDHPAREVLEPGERSTYMNDIDPARDSPVTGGIWMKPGEYHAGGIPVLYNDVGTPIGERTVREWAGLPEFLRSREHRQRRGAFARAELRAEHITAREASDRMGPFRRSSADVVGSQMIDPLNPVGRRRTARIKQERAATVRAVRRTPTWIEKLNAQMEGTSNG